MIWKKASEQLPETRRIVLWHHKTWKRSKEGYVDSTGLLRVWGGAYTKSENMPGLVWAEMPEPGEQS